MSSKSTTFILIHIVITFYDIINVHYFTNISNNLVILQYTQYIYIIYIHWINYITSGISKLKTNK